MVYFWVNDIYIYSRDPFDENVLGPSPMHPSPSSLSSNRRKSFMSRDSPHSPSTKLSSMFCGSLGRTFYTTYQERVKDRQLYLLCKSVNCKELAESLCALLKVLSIYISSTAHIISRSEFAQKCTMHPPPSSLSSNRRNSSLSRVTPHSPSMKKSSMFCGSLGRTFFLDP